MPASRTRLLLGFLILAILAAAAGWVMKSSDQAARAGRTTDEIAAPAAPSPGAAALDADIPAAAGLERSEAAATAPDAPAKPDSILTIRAVHAVTREPVPHAEILYIWREDPNFMAMINAWKSSDRETEYRKHGRSLRADERGEARIGVAGTFVQFAARSGSLYGTGASFAEEPGPREAVLLMGEDRSFTVRVVNAAGAPVADVPLCLFTPSDRAARDPQRTDENGLAVFGHLQTFFQTEGEVPDLALTFAFPVLDRPRVPIRWQDPPAEPVTLVMPPTGKLAVEVRDASGAPWLGRSSVHLQQHVDPPKYADSSSSFQPRLGLGVTTAATDDQGVARFPFVGLGMTLDAAGHFTTGSTAWTQATGAGPLSAGEEARMRLDVGPQPAVVVFRIVLPDGSLSSDEPFQGLLVWLDPEGKPLQWDSQGTNSLDAVRRLPIPPEEPADWVRREYHTYRQEAEPGQLPVIAMLDLSGPLHQGENEFGDVPAHEAPLLAGGIVVDEAGNPVEGASISAQGLIPPEPGPFQFLHGSFPCISDAAGNFQLGGVAQPGASVLVAKQPNYLQGRAPLVPGADGHRIVMPSACELTGEVLLDEGIPAREIEVSALRDGKRTQFISRPWRTSLRPDGSFALSGLEPGIVTLRLSYTGANFTIFDVPDVTAAVNGAPDPRLHPLDLRGKIRRVRLLVLDAEGGQLSQAEFAVLNPATSALEWANTFNGQAVLYLSAPSVTVGLRAPGFAGKLLEGVSQDAEVRLERAPEVEFALEDSSIMAKHPGTVLYALWNSPLTWRAPQTIRLNADGKGRFSLPGWGEFRIGLFVPVGDGSERLDVFGAKEEPWPSFTFAAGAPIPAAMIPCSLATVEAAMARLAQEEDE